MSDLDHELRTAISDLEQADQQPGGPQALDGAGAPTSGSPSAGEAAVSGGLVSDRPRTVQAPKRNVGLLLALLAIAGAILALVLTSVDEAAVYSVTTDQLLREKDKFAGRNLRVEGDLVKGSLRQRAEPCEYRFSIEKNGEKMPVRYAACVVPDTFRDVPDMDVQVTAEGRLTSEGYFEATHIMAKCPSKYEMERRKKNGEAAPHGDVMGGAVPALQN